jgi:hypothetical protein
MVYCKIYKIIYHDGIYEGEFFNLKKGKWNNVLH